MWLHESDLFRNVLRHRDYERSEALSAANYSSSHTLQNSACVASIITIYHKRPKATVQTGFDDAMGDAA